MQLEVVATYLVVYDRNHLFGLGPIPKQKLKIGRNLWLILKLTETYRNHKILN